MQNITNVFMLHATSNPAEINVVKRAYIWQFYTSVDGISINRINTLFNFVKLD